DDHVDAHWPLELDAVIVDEALRLEAAIRPFGDCPLDLCLRHFEQAIEAAEDLPFAELADELCEPPLAQPVGPELAADIAQHEFRGAAVGADEPLDIAVAP